MGVAGRRGVSLWVGGLERHGSASKVAGSPGGGGGGGGLYLHGGRGGAGAGGDGKHCITGRAASPPWFVREEWLARYRLHGPGWWWWLHS